MGEYLDYKNCKCRQKIAGSLEEECIENIDGNEMIYNETLNVSLRDFKCGSGTVYIVLFVVFLVTSTVISTVLFTFIGIQKRMLQIFTTNINADS